MKMCTVLPSTAPLVTTTAELALSLSPVDSPVPWESAFGHGAGDLLNIQPKGTVFIGSALAPTIISPGAVENSALWVIHLCHLQFKSMSQHWISFCVFPSPSPLLSPSPRAAPGFCSRQQVTHSWQQHSHSAFLIPGVSAPQHICNPASELSGDMFGLTVYSWLSVDLSPFFWMFKYFSWESTPWHLPALFFSQPVLAWFRTVIPFQ